MLKDTVIGIEDPVSVVGTSRVLSSPGYLLFSGLVGIYY